MNRYLVLLETSEANGEHYAERAFESRAESPEEAAREVISPVNLPDGWHLHRARVYELAGEEPSKTLLVRPAPQWVIQP